MAADWMLALCTLKGTQLSILDPIAMDVRVDYRLNRSSTLTFTVPADDPLTNTVHSDGFPYLDVGNRVVKAYRRQTEVDPWTLRYVGVIWTLEDSGDGTSVQTQVTCFDMLKYLERRAIRRHDGFVVFTVKWFGDGDAGGNDRFDGSRGPTHIVQQMLERTKNLAGPQNPPGNFTAAFLPIQIGSFPDTSTPITVEYDKEMIMPAIIRFCDAGLMDLRVEYLDANVGGSPGSVHMKLGGVRRLGGTVPGSATFKYAGGDNSAIAFSRTRSMEDAANSVLAYGKSAKQYGLVFRDEGSDDIYNLLESIEVWPDVPSSRANHALIRYLALAELALRAAPKDLVTIVPTPDSGPNPFTHYNLGDVIGIEAGQSAFDEMREAITGNQRLYGFSVVLDEDFGETTVDFITSAQDL